LELSEFTCSVNFALEDPAGTETLDGILTLPPDTV
jgi:hypothetical protein